MKDIRLLPLLMLAAGALLVLRLTTLAVGEPPQLGVTPAHAQEAPAETAGAGEDAEPALADEDAAEAPADAAAAAVGAAGGKSAIVAIGESLAERRAALEARAADLDLREKLLAATQARVEERIGELEAIELRLEAMLKAREEEEDAKFAGLVEMYSKMRAKDAARIMNGLEMPVLEKVAARIAPRQMSEIMASLDPAVAQQLTASFSAEPAELTVEPRASGELPKIVGTRPGQ